MIRHGTITGYTTDRCRCDDCRRAIRERQRERRQQTGRHGSSPPMYSDREALRDLLLELAPDGLTDDCPARKAKAAELSRAA